MRINHADLPPITELQNALLELSKRSSALSSAALSVIQHGVNQEALLALVNARFQELQNMVAFINDLDFPIKNAPVLSAEDAQIIDEKIGQLGKEGRITRLVHSEARQIFAMEQAELSGLFTIYDITDLDLAKFKEYSIDNPGLIDSLMFTSKIFDEFGCSKKEDRKLRFDAHPDPETGKPILFLHIRVDTSVDLNLFNRLVDTVIDRCIDSNTPLTFSIRQM